MKTFGVVLQIIAIALSQDSSQPKPAKPLDPKNPQSLIEHAAHNVRIQKCYKTNFKASLTPPQGDPIKYQGECVWGSPGILYIHYTATGGDDKSIVRVGNCVWVHHSLVGWTTADEAGMPGAGRGIQNPEEVLAVLAKNSDDAKLHASGVIGLTLSGNQIEKIMKEQSSQGAFDWKESTASVELRVDGQIRLKGFRCQASLKPTDPKIKGTIEYVAEVQVVSYNSEAELLFFRDELKEGKRITVEIPLSAPIKKAMESLRTTQAK